MEYFSLSLAISIQHTHIHIHPLLIYETVNFYVEWWYFRSFLSKYAFTVKQSFFIKQWCIYVINACSLSLRILNICMWMWMWVCVCLVRTMLTVGSFLSVSLSLSCLLSLVYIARIHFPRYLFFIRGISILVHILYRQSSGKQHTLSADI